MRTSNREQVDEQVSLDKQVEETRKEEDRRLQAEAKARELQRQTEELKFTEQVREAATVADCRFFMPTVELIKLLRDEPGFQIGPDGAFVDGQRVGLPEALEAFRLRHKTLADDVVIDRIEA